VPKTLFAKLQAKDHDRGLLARIAAKDRQALEELYLNYHRRLARFLSRFTQSYENVEEIINDTFMVVWQAAPQFRHDSQVSTWILGIAYRTALKSLRRVKRHTTAIDLEDAPEPSVDPAQDTELQDWVARALQELSEEQRLTLELAYHMGHSLEEIAAITAAPIGTVKARMYHARARLRQCLPEIGGGDAGTPSRSE